MLKRKALTEIYPEGSFRNTEESNQEEISSIEVLPRRIYRAIRPVRSTIKPLQFKLSSQLLSKTQENELLLPQNPPLPKQKLNLGEEVKEASPHKKVSMLNFKLCGITQIADSMKSKTESEVLKNFFFGYVDKALGF